MHDQKEKHYQFSLKIFIFKCNNLDKKLCIDCITSQLNKTFPHQKQIAEKQGFKGKFFYFNHRISFDIKGPISPSSEGKSNIMVKLVGFTHYIALNSVPHCNASYAYTILYEHWIAKIKYLESFSQTMEQNSLTTKSLHYVTSIISNKNLEDLMAHGQMD